MADIVKSGRGFEGMEGQDFGIPLLSICQTNNPQLIEGHQKYIEGIRPGNIFNTQSGAFWKEINVIPLRYAWRTIEWKPREQGGGWVASYRRGEEPNDIESDPLTGRLRRKSTGNSIVQTSYHLLMVKEDGWNKAIIPMYSTALKHSRKWNSMMIGFRGANGQPLDMFSHFFSITTIREQNPKGVWYGWKIDPAGLVEGELFHAAEHEYETQENFLPDRLIAMVNGGNGDKDVM